MAKVPYIVAQWDLNLVRWQLARLEANGKFFGKLEDAELEARDVVGSNSKL